MSQDSSEQKGEPFLSTLTGLLTAIGGILTAIGALVAALFGANILGPGETTPIPSPIAITATLPPASNPTALPTTTGGILLEDTFGDPGSGWETYADGDLETGYQDGELRIAVLQPDIIAWTTFPEANEFTDFSLEVDARQIAGPITATFGLVVRVQADDDNLYRFGISGDGYYLVDRHQAGQWTTLKDWEASEAIRQGLDAVNHLKIVCDRSKLSLYVNDTYLVDLIDNTFPSGQIGFTAGTPPDQGGVVVHFDNLRVLSLEES